MSSHTIVFAQLIIDGKRYGPQPFLVQIRSREGILEYNIKLFL